MQTYLPYPSFTDTARVLDRQRLGKQRVETLQILRALTGVTRGWRNHPAARMWSGHEAALAAYGMAICTEWLARGYKDTLLPQLLPYHVPPAIPPPWLGDPAFHAAHRAALLYKSPTWYAQWGWTESPEVSYIWPV